MSVLLAAIQAHTVERRRVATDVSVQTPRQRRGGPSKDGVW